MPVVLEAATLSSILTDIGSVVTQGISWVTETVTAIVGSPLLFFYAGALPMIGIGIGLYHRFVR